MNGKSMIGGGCLAAVEQEAGEIVLRETTASRGTEVGRLFLTNRRLIYLGARDLLPVKHVVRLKDISATELKAGGRDLVVVIKPFRQTLEVRVGPRWDLYLSGFLLFWSSRRMKAAAAEWREALEQARGD